MKINEHGEKVADGNKAKSDQVIKAPAEGFSPPIPAKKPRVGAVALNSNIDIKAQPQDPADVEDPIEKRIEYLRAKSDRTLEEGLELQELEVGLEKSKEINAGWTSSAVHDQQEGLRQREKNLRKERKADNA